VAPGVGDRGRGPDQPLGRRRPHALTPGGDQVSAVTTADSRLCDTIGTTTR
jgi:hypothetical protein